MAPRAITVIAYTLLPFVSPYRYRRNRSWIFSRPFYCYGPCLCRCPDQRCVPMRSEEHTSELQSRGHLVCRLLLEKKKQTEPTHPIPPRRTPQRMYIQTN